MPFRQTSVRLALCLVAFVAALAAPGPAAYAALYDVPILVDDEDGLRDLLEEGEITQEEFEQLLAMLERPLDLNRSRREALFDLPGLTWPMVEEIVAYREEQAFRGVEDLEAIGVPVDVIRQLRAFVKVAQRLQRAPVVEGTVGLRAIEQFGDDRSPSLNLRGRALLFDTVEVGVSTLLQDRTGPFSWHHQDGLTWLSAGGPDYSFRVPKFYAMMEEPGWGVIVGSYQLGFGEKLAFDETSRAEPDGFYPDDLLPQYEETGKFGVPERLYGVAASLREISLGEGAGALDATLWLSYWPYDISQNDVDSFLRVADDTVFFNSSGGPNPLFCQSGVDPELCAVDDSALRQGRHAFQTLRAAFTELVVGGHVAYVPTPQWKIGATAYWAMIDWLESGSDVFFSPSSGWPNRDQFGAFGLDVQGHIAFVSVFAEYARMFDGGNALSGRVVLGWKKFDVELNGRWYQAEFDNPHARGKAADDEYFGQRDRDEVGGGARVTFRPLKWFNGRVDLDVWYRPTLDVSALKLTSRFDFVPLDWLVLSTGLDFKDKVLSQGGRDEEYNDDGGIVSVVDPYERRIVDVTDERDVGRGARLAAWFQVRAEPLRDLNIVAFFKSTLWDAQVSERATFYPEPIRFRLNQFYANNFAHDFYAWLLVSYKPIDRLEVSARVKFLDEETEFDVRGDTFVEGWLQVRWKIIDALSLQVRYRVRGYLDENIARLSEEDLQNAELAGDGGVSNYYHVRVGDVEHLLKAALEYKF